MSTHPRPPLALLAALAVALPLGLAGGSADAGPSSPTHQASARYTITPFHPTRHDRPRLVREWRTFRAEHAATYRTAVRVSCFCARIPELVTEVDGHRVTSVHVAGHDREAGGGHGYEVDQLFRLLRRAYATADHVGVVWGAHGVPRRISIDPDRLAADDERFLVVRFTNTSARD